MSTFYYWIVQVDSLYFKVHRRQWGEPNLLVLVTLLRIFYGYESCNVNFHLSLTLSSTHPLRLRGNLFPFICCRIILQDLKLLYIKPRPAYRDNVRPLMLAWDYDSSQSWQSWQRVTEGAKAVNCHSPWQTGCTFLSTEAWVNHNSKHRTSTLSSFNTLPWWTCVRWGEEVRWLTPIICCLTSWQFSGFM